MHLEGLTIALRTRTPWEATDLGIALVRAHAARIYGAWLLVTLPAFVLLNAFGWWIGMPWTAALALWWLKPAFDRVPLYVISRAVFGSAPGVRETFAAQRSWGVRALLPWLTWRRLHPGRAMLLPVDMLEGARGAQRRERVYVLSRAYASPNMMLTLIGANLEIMLGIALVMLGLMFVPVEFFTESAKAVWQTFVEEPPRWAQVLGNGIGWCAMSIVEPFYIGAGFGLYLNRRMQLEAWDIELAFRRMAARLARPLAAAALLLAALFTLAAPLRAAQEPATGASAQSSGSTDANSDDVERDDATSDEDKSKDKRPKHVTKVKLQELFADSYRDDTAKFEADVARVYKEADLNPTTKQWAWKRRHPDDEDDTKPSAAPEWAKALGKGVSFLAQFGLWIALGVLLIAIALNHKRWLSWLGDRKVTRTPPPLETHVQRQPERLPDDVPAAVRALLREGAIRAALALLYRAAVERLVTQLGAPLPPGATEADCLRQAKRLRDTSYRELFARIVRCWQTAAYAQRLPGVQDVEALLADWNTPAETVP